jgi:hypothetical protein
MIRTKRSLAVVTVVSAAALLLAGCALSPGQSSSGPAAPPNGTQDGGSQGVPLDGKADGASPEQGLAAGQQVITTGWIAMTVEDPIAKANDAVALIEQRGGHIDNRSEQAATDSQPASAQLTIRVPSDSIDETLEAVKKLGQVDSVSIQEADVTAQVNDLDARISALQASVDRLTGLLSNAASVSDLVELETALSSRQADLDSLTSQRDSIGDQVDYSTIQLQLSTKGPVPKGVPGDFWSGLGVGWATLLAAAGSIVVVFGVALPWLGVIAVLVLISLLIVRLSTRGARKNPTAP